MKKLLAIVLAAACAVSMAACVAKTGGIITLPEASMADGQLAAPPEVTSVPYPKETDYVKNGTVDYDAYDKAYDAWLEAWQEKLQTMVDPADVAHWFTSSIPVLLQGAGDENRVCSPLNVYLALAMLAAVTDGQTRRLLWDVVTELRRKEKLTVFLTTHYMEEAADADYVILLDSGRVVGEGTPLALKNTYAGDHITLYGVEEAAVRALGRKYAPVQGGWRIEVENTGEATKLILAQPALFTDYEITKGNMDDVFLAATGKKLHGGAEV